MGTLRLGAIVPHAPLLVPGVSASPELGALERVRAATRDVARAWGRTTVLISPHGSSAGVYRGTRGDLDAFGVRGAVAQWNLDENAGEALRMGWDRPWLDEPCDHGVVVPLLLAGPTEPIVAVAMSNETDPAEEARSLADAIAALEGEVSVVASVNTGAGITPRAPLTELPGSAALEAELRGVLERDVGGLLELAPRLGSEGGSCGAGPLMVLGHLFGGARARVLSHEWPVGVGYLVATVESP